MQSFRKIVLKTGIAGGSLFDIHASFPNVYSWPMIWPALAGAIAFWMVTREPRPHRLRVGLGAALATGLLLSALAFVGVSAVTYALLHTDIVPAVRQAGAARGLITVAGIVTIAVSLALVDLVVALLAAVLVLPVRYVQLRHAQA